MRLIAALAATVLLAACTDRPQPTTTPTATPTPAASPTTTGQTTPTTQPTPSPSPTRSAGPTATATESPTGSPGAVDLAFEPFADGFDSPVLVTHAGDDSGRLYVVEQPGVIRVLDGAGALLEAPFLDIDDRVTSGGERGLLGLAFHPDYATNGRFFVNYTDHAGDTVVAEYARASDATADPGSERILFTVAQPYSNHNGGMVAFGPDGGLYIGMGDGGSGGDPHGYGQDPNARLGKMLRLDVDTASAEPEIWFSGLRNPWRFTFDRLTGDMFIGDVGQGRWEEIDVAPAGAEAGLNFGWNILEGPDCYLEAGCDRTGLTAPVAWYAHSGSDCSVSGGYVYRGTAFPELAGTYLYGDYCSGIVRGFDAAAAAGGDEVTTRNYGDTEFNISSFGEDEAGEMFLVDLGGRVLRVTAEPASAP